MFSIFTGGNAMIKSKFKRVTSLFLATLMCVITFAGIGSTTAYAASGEKADVYTVSYIHLAYVLFRLTISALILSKMQTMSAIVP